MGFFSFDRSFVHSFAGSVVRSFAVRVRINRTYFVALLLLCVVIHFENLFNRFGVCQSARTATNRPNDRTTERLYSIPNNYKRFQLTAPLIKITIFVGVAAFFLHLLISFMSVAVFISLVAWFFHFYWLSDLRWHN